MASQGLNTGDPISGDTNLFMASELRDAGREHADSSASGDTNPFTSDEIRDRTAGAGANADETSPPDPHPSSIRIILEPASTEPGAGSVAVGYTPFDGTNSSDDDDNARRHVLLNAAGTPASTNKLAIAQSSKYAGVTVEACGPDGSTLSFRLFFDPGRDRMILVNKSVEPIGASGVRGDQEQEKEPTNLHLDLDTPVVLDAGLWEIIAASGRHVLKFSILPRRHVTISRPGDTGQARREPSKRAYESSQSEGEKESGGEGERGSRGQVKRGRLDESRGEDQGASVVFQAVSAADAGPSTTVADRPPGEAVIPLVTHPLEQLQMGDKAQIIGPGGAEYTLTRGDNIATTGNTHVFQAEHSRLPGRMAVVKVIRTPTHDVRPDAHDNGSAIRITRAAEMWLREYKHHSRLCQHTAVVRLHKADARFLSLYMEHVDAPALGSHRDHGPNPTCTLSAADASRVLADMSTALFYVHDRGIVHNDIKPANILYSRTRGAVLIDFGLSSDVSDTATHTGGSPWYVPPEYAVTGDRGTAGDMYALGVVMLFVLGRLPLPEYRRPRVHWIIADVRRTDPRAARRAQESMRQWGRVVSEAARGLDLKRSRMDMLVAKMLAEDVDQRIGSAELAEVSASV